MARVTVAVAVAVAAAAAAVLLAAPPARASTTLYVASLCGTASCRAVELTVPCAGAGDPACGCVPSVPGELCAECSFRGYLAATPSGDVCRCYEDATADPNNARGPCLSIIAAETVANVSVTYSRAWCDAFCDRELGCFQPPPPFAYGREPAPQITACANPAFGPPPGAIREAFDTLPPMTCNSYGVAVDNSSAADGWTLCGGHGTWDRPGYRCACAEGWALADPGVFYAGIGGERPLVCTQCAPLRGPRPGDDDPAATPPCSAPFTPDPLTGLESVCGGHGAPDGAGGCACFSSPATGYWALAPLTVPATTLVYTAPFGTAFAAQTAPATVMTCGACASGLDPATGCVSPAG